MDAPVELEILRVLLEAGEENLPTLLNSVRAADAPDALLARVDRALDTLERQGCVAFYWYASGWVALAAAERGLVLPLADNVVFDPASGGWRAAREQPDREGPIVVLTGRGEARARRTLRVEV
jgi:hypothetical protein